MAHELQVTLFGQPVIRLNDRPLSLGRNARTLFYYLAVTAQVHERINLAYLLWPDFERKSALNNLRATLNQLNRHLSDYLRVDRASIGIRNEALHEWLDVAKFCALLKSKQADINQLQAAVDLYQGPLLKHWLPDEDDAFGEWLQAERATLHHQAIDAMERLIASYHAAKLHESAIQVARRLLRLESWREETHCLLMQMLIEAGQYSSALAQYRLCQKGLEQMGVDYSPKTKALYQCILHRREGRI